MTALTNAVSILAPKKGGKRKRSFEPQPIPDSEKKPAKKRGRKPAVKVPTPAPAAASQVMTCFFSSGAFHSIFDMLFAAECGRSTRAIPIESRIGPTTCLCSMCRFI